MHRISPHLFSLSPFLSLVSTSPTRSFENGELSLSCPLSITCNISYPIQPEKRGKSSKQPQNDNSIKKKSAHVSTVQIHRNPISSRTTPNLRRTSRNRRLWHLPYPSGNHASVDWYTVDGGIDRLILHFSSK